MLQLTILALFLLLMYGAVRLVSTMVAGLAGARHRAYRQLAARYRGRYENRGIVDPPTVSFGHNGSAVRVGLAPVVPGQPAQPRTRVVARFARGLPFRLELIPTGRPVPPQPPKGTRLVNTGHLEFDRAYLVRANDPDMARAFLHSDVVRDSLDVLRRLAPPCGMLLSVNPERLLVQVDRNLGQHATLLDLAVNDSLIIHDSLIASVATRLDQGIDIVIAGKASDLGAEGPPECEVCGDPIAGGHVLCVVCQTPFHKDCWAFVGGCSTFGCSSKQSHPV